MTFAKLDSDLLLFVISKFLTSQSIEHLFCVNKGINSAFKEKEYSSYVWNLFWKRERKCYVEGQMWYEEFYKDGKLEGIQKKWYPTGQLEHEEFYKDGKREGMQKGWYPGGQIQYEWLYDDGEREGIQKAWYLGGQLQYEHFYKDGQRI